MKEHTGPRLTLLQHTFYVMKMEHMCCRIQQAKFSKHTVTHRAIWLWYQLTSQLLIKMHFNSFKSSLFPTPGIISAVFSALQTREEIRWGKMLFISKEAQSFSKLEGGTRNSVPRRQVRSQGANSCYQKQPRLILPDTAQSSFIFDPVGVWSQQHLLQGYSSTHLLNTSLQLSD